MVDVTFYLDPSRVTGYSREHLDRVLALLPEGRHRGDGPLMTMPNKDGESWPVWRMGDLEIYVAAPDRGPNALTITAFRPGERLNSGDIAAVIRGFTDPDAQIEIQQGIPDGAPEPQPVTVIYQRRLR